MTRGKRGGDRRGDEEEKRGKEMNAVFTWMILFGLFRTFECIHFLVNSQLLTSYKRWLVITLPNIQVQAKTSPRLQLWLLLFASHCCFVYVFGPSLYTFSKSGLCPAQFQGYSTICICIALIPSNFLCLLWKIDVLILSGQSFLSFDQPVRVPVWFFLKWHCSPLFLSTISAVNL